jgi:hypothetical protein
LWARRFRLATRADQIAYTRSTPTLISTTGKKAGVPFLTETVSVDPAARLLTLSYRIATPTRDPAEGSAVFEKLNT